MSEGRVGLAFLYVWVFEDLFFGLLPLFDSVDSS